MNSDFLSGLLGGQGNNNLLATLIPLLLGGRSLDPKALLSGTDGLGNLFSGGHNGNAEEFPPLFGALDSGPKNPANSLWNMLSGIMPQGKKETATPPPSSSEYPYELQYNHPYKD